MKKIMYFFQTYFHKGGAEKNTLQLVSSFYKKYQILLAGPMSQNFKQYLKNFNVRSYDFPKFSKLDPLAFLKIREFILKEKPDIIHTMDPRARFFVVCNFPIQNRTFKLIHTCHCTPLFWAQNRIKRAIYKRIEKWLNNKTDKIIFVSEAVKNLYEKEKILSRGNWKIIYNGLDLEIASKLLMNKESIKKEIFKKYQILNQKIITFIGKIELRKGLIYLIEAIKNLSKDFTNFRIFLVGDGQNKPEIERRIKKEELDKFFVLTGFKEQEEIFKFLIASDIFVLPSLYELLPYAILEAMSVGLPVIATDVGGIREVVKHRRNGLLIKPKDAEALTQAIREILTNKKLANEISFNNLNDIKKFSIQEMIKEVDKIYYEV